MSELVWCPACGRPARRVLDALTRGEMIECDSAYSPCSPEQIEEALSGRRAPQASLFESG
jgi:hypothetical protein